MSRGSASRGKGDGIEAVRSSSRPRHPRRAEGIVEGTGASDACRSGRRAVEVRSVVVYCTYGFQSVKMRLRCARRLRPGT